jgi:hypothetical protein
MDHTVLRFQPLMPAIQRHRVQIALADPARVHDRGEIGCEIESDPFVDERKRDSSRRMSHNHAGSIRVGSLVSVAAFAYAGVMHATAIVGGKVVRFKLSPSLARAHRQNRDKAVTEAEAVAFVETKRRARALRRARPYLASRP